MKKLLILLISFSSCYLMTAQRGWEIGGWMGTAHYFGDLNTSYDVTMPGFAGGLIMRYNFNDRLCLKFSGNAGSIMGDDANSANLYEQARNLSFKSPILDGGLQFEFNFLEYLHGSRDQFYTPYLFAGINAFSFNPMAELDGQWYELRDYGTEGQFKGEEYFTIQGGLMYGAGVKIALNYEWSIDIELSARHLFTDYLDDVSTTYPDMEDLEKLHGEIAVQLSDRSIDIPGVPPGQISGTGKQRGNSANNDAYVFFQIGILRYFGDLRCPSY